MPTLRSSKSGQGPQGFNVSPIKSTRKVKKGRTFKKKVAKATSTVGQSEVSSAPLPTLPLLQVKQDIYTLISYSVQVIAIVTFKLPDNK